MAKKIISLGTLILGLAVAMGAFAAHALKGSLDAYSQEIWQKAVFYHVMHGCALVMVGILAHLTLISNVAGKRLATMFGLGILLFCGSLYTLALTQKHWLGAITPFGGVLFILAWIILSREIIHNRQE